MSYDSRGQLAAWSAPSGTVGSAHYLYDLQGNRVLTNSSTASSTTDTIYFDGYTETVLSGGTTTTTKYDSANGTRIAVRIGGATLDYLLSDPLGSNSVALNDTGQVIGLEHYSPYGTVDSQWGSMPTSFNYAGERLDGQTGLLYDTFRYYDPLSGRFVRADNVQDNSTGMDPYAYVGDNPETRNDPSGHCFPFCLITAAIGTIAGAVVGVVGEAAQHGADFGHYNWGHVAMDTGVGAAAGFMVGTGVGAAVGIGMIAGGLSSGIGVAASAVKGQNVTFASGLQSIFEGATIGGIMSGLTAGIGEGLGLGVRQLFQRASQGTGRALLQGGIQALGGFGGNILTQAWNSWWDGNPPSQSLDFGQAIAAGALSFGAGFLGQWVYNHVSLFQTGVAYASRVARQAARDANWSVQDMWANSVSGVAQGVVQIVEVTAPNQSSFTYDGPRGGHAF